MKKSIIVAGFSLLSVMLPFEAMAVTFTKMYVFGDSLSDPGNIFNATRLASFFDESISVIPQPPYYGGRYSNGLIWVDYLAEDLGLTLKPSTKLSVLFPRLPLPSPITLNFEGELEVSFYFNGATRNRSVNFAFGGAQTGFTGVGEFGDRIPGVLRQVEGFKNDQRNSSADPNALYIVWAGPNDYQTITSPNVAESVDNLETAIATLFNLGARNFLVPNLPDLGKTARALSLGSEASNQLTSLTTDHNGALATTLNDLSQSLSGINLISLDVYSLFNNAIANPQQFGLTNVTEPCLGVTICSNPNEYLFWDGIHPTTIAHQELADFAFAALTPSLVPALASPAPLRTLTPEPNAESVPEPASALSLGVLGIAWLLRARFN